MPDINLIAMVGAVPVSDILCSAYKGSRFGSLPVAYDTAVPGGAADATATSGVAFGGPGQVVLTVPTFEIYWVAVPYGGHIGWVECPTFSIPIGGVTSSMILDGSIVDADINAAAAIAIAKLATNPLARANHTGTQLAATVSDFDTQVRTSRLDQMAAPTAAVALGAQKITGLADPASAQDAATRAWVLANLRTKTDFYATALIVAGVAVVANNVLPPGYRVGQATTLNEFHVVVGTAPTGAAMIVKLRINGTILAAANATVAISATTADVTGLTQALSVGDLLTWDITQIGSTIAGSDVAVAMLGT